MTSYLWRKQWLYGCADCADCEFRLIGHDVCGLDITVVHGVFKRRSSIGVFMTGIAIEGYFRSFSGNETRHNLNTETLLTGPLMLLKREIHSVKLDHSIKLHGSQ